MSEVETTRLSSRGQVVIPESIRKNLGLEPGHQFMVLAEGDVIILKALTKPDMSAFDELIRGSRTAARRAGLRKKDLEEAIRRARGR
ncbi:MAG: AbrB/MazE/SpoVT family DNA-binding domain-containing protein [Planctomycetes bacterium]|nr:AbrB/MazE/SpoVT family DNA-binding domain-containing protein [Planctomycetota bacterium]